MAPEESIKIPSDVQAVVAKFGDRRRADAAVEALTAAGFGTDQITFVARGAETVDGVFKPGVLMITVHASGRDEEAVRVLRRSGATDVEQGFVSATGEVESLEAMREDARSA